MKDDKTRKSNTLQTEEAASTATSTVTTTIERPSQAATEAQDAASAEPTLTPLEEKVIRMRYGRSLKGQEALEFAPGASMETRLKLALIESRLLEAFTADALDPDPDTGSPRSVLADSID